MPKKKIKIIVAMSGGVDSSVAAALLKRAGFDVVGIFMKFWLDRRSLGKGGKGYNRCCSTESEKMARQVAKKIGIPFYVLNVEKEFKKKVVDYFLKEIKTGNTPNPCVVCNKEIKFSLLLEKALKLGAEFVATGHYARTSLGDKFFIRLNVASRRRPSKNLSPRSIELLKAKDQNKDQSYFLWQLNQKQLAHVLFPVGNYTKPEVRKLAKKFKLPTAETKESQEVCFVQGDINNFLKEYLKLKPGNIIEGGKIIGRHNGLHFYTIGQRKGIGLPGGPYYVVKKDFSPNVLVVSKNEKDLLKKELVAKNVNWVSGIQPKLPLKVMAKIRYRSASSTATVFQISNFKFKIRFDMPQRAITPGQSVVFYRGEELLGGGIIDVD